jgi:serine/threonine protein phosphatase PrpC
MINKINIYFTSITGRRISNEDEHTIITNITNKNDNINNINLFGIYDGHGGDKISKYLSEVIPLYYCSKDKKYPFSKKYHDNVFIDIQNKILKLKDGNSSGSTCLLNIMYKYDDELHFNTVNLGDSRLVIVYNSGNHKQVSNDHKPDDKIEKTRIEKIGGEVYKDSEGVYRIGDLSLSRAFGDGDNAPYISQTPDVYYNKVTKNTKYIVMACDGLWDVIENKDLFELLESYKSNNSKNLAVNLANEALKKGSYDNVSIIIIEFI